MEELRGKKCVAGVVGLGVMGANLARNLARNLDAPIAVYDLDPERSAALVVRHPELPLRAFDRLDEFAADLDTPRVILLMVPAGVPVDSATEALRPYLQPGDVIIDGGNSHFEDTERRVKHWAEIGVRFLGMGTSGGEQGALLGPALMPGGDPSVWNVLRPLFEPIAARADDGAPCVALVGSGGAGHFTKMVHNGIEYADLQLIAEAYSLLRASGMTVLETTEVFRDWNTGDDRSYLLDSTIEVLEQNDDLSSGALVEKVSDAAQGKGTGAWTVIAGAEMGVSVSIIAEAFFARSVSSSGTERDSWRGVAELAPPTVSLPVQTIRGAYLSARLLAYQQGLTLLGEASAQRGWNVRLDEVVRIWRAGCIIRAGFLDAVKQAYGQNPQGTLFLTQQPFLDQLIRAFPALQETVAAASIGSVFAPATAAALNHLTALRSRQLPTALVQLLRDYFGSHTFERVDVPGHYHVAWDSDRLQKRI